jgi:hypothetical protein
VYGDVGFTGIGRAKLVSDDTLKVPHVFLLDILQGKREVTLKICRPSLRKPASFVLDTSSVNICKYKMKVI